MLHGRVVAAAAAALTASLLAPLGAQQAQLLPTCRVTGKAMSGARPLPGVSLVLLAGDAVKSATSTDVDGSYAVIVPAPGTYRLTAELTGFTVISRDLVVGAPPCDQTIDLTMALAAGAAPASVPVAAAGTPARFATLNVQANTATATAADLTPPDREAIDAVARSLLPPGFTVEGSTESVAINGSMAQVDRGMLTDRLLAVGRGEIDPVTGELRTVGPDGQMMAVDQAGAGRAGRGGPGGPRGGGPGGRGFAIGGRGGRQNAYTFTSNYSFGGSALNAAPYSLRPDTPATERPFVRQTFGGTVGGPVKIPRIYDGTRRTNFQFNYSGNRSDNLFDQYATVPTDAIRGGDFSGTSVVLRDPGTGVPFAGNRIPDDRISPAARTLLEYIPSPNLPGDRRNFHFTTTANSVSDNVSVRLTHNFTTPAAGRGGPGGRGAGGRGGGGRGGRGAQGVTVNLTAQMQYRRNASEQVNVFPALGGQTRGASLSVPVTVNVARRRDMHAFNVNFTRSWSRSTNRYAHLLDVAGLAGINGVADDPFDWGVPTLSFSTFSSVRDVTPTRRSDRRVTSSYTWTHPFGNHTMRMGAEYSRDWSDNQTDANARGSFVFTGLYAAGGGAIPRGAGVDFADFLLGLPQQASIQYGPGNVGLRGDSLGVYWQDDWRKGPGLTFNLGVRYDLVRPYREANGQMVNLDAAPGFSAVAPVISGQTGPFSGVFPSSLINADVNNLSPRVGLAWRAAPATIVRTGYGITYNAGSYSTIARQLTGQPPFAVTGTSLGTIDDPLTLTDPFVGATPTTTTNNYGIERDYVLGVIQTWNVDVTRDFGLWNVGAGYIGTRGTNLDMLRAPNRGPSGLLLPDVQAFTWQSSEGRSMLAAGSFRVRRRPVAGVGFGAAYTLARSRDNTTATGGGASVAQDDRNLEAEWALSSFDRRHQFAADAQIELPFGPNRPFLNGGGPWAALLEGWNISVTFGANSGTPLTPRVSGAAADVARGVNGTLRAAYNGQPIALDDPTIDAFFNTAAFSAPASGTFGNALRNMIIGPGNRQLDANFSRDVRLGGNRSLSLQLSASNLLNLVQWGGVDTNVNSLTFGQVTSVRPMRSMQLNVRLRY